MARRTFAVLCLGIFLIGFPTVASLQTLGPSRWVLTKQVDKMTDAESFTVLRRSAEGTASLGLHCGGGGYTAFLTLPRIAKVDAMTLAEVRFDKRDPIGFTLRRFDQELLVSLIGGSRTESNFVFMTDDVGKAVAGDFSAEETARMGMRLVKEIQSGARMVYRLSLANAGSGTEATFNLAGFAQTAAPMLKACPVQ
jgi:hypothetical protein